MNASAKLIRKAVSRAPARTRLIAALNIKVLMMRWKITTLNIPVGKEKKIIHGFW
jgi:hypothetical protein